MPANDDEWSLSCFFFRFFSFYYFALQCRVVSCRVWKIVWYYYQLLLLLVKQQLQHHSISHQSNRFLNKSQENHKNRASLWTLISDHSDPYKFLFYCPATHVTSQVLQPESVNKQYRGRHTFISLYSLSLLPTHYCH